MSVVRAADDRKAAGSNHTGAASKLFLGQIRPPHKRHKLMVPSISMLPMPGEVKYPIWE